MALRAESKSGQCARYISRSTIVTLLMLISFTAAAHLLFSPYGFNPTDDGFTRVHSDLGAGSGSGPSLVKVFTHCRRTQDDHAVDTRS